MQCADVGDVAFDGCELAAAVVDKPGREFRGGDVGDGEDAPVCVAKMGVQLDPVVERALADPVGLACGCDARVPQEVDEALGASSVRFSEISRGLAGVGLRDSCGASSNMRAKAKREAVSVIAFAAEESHTEEKVKCKQAASWRIMRR